MKKLFLVAMVYLLSATSGLLGQHTQSLSFTDPGPLEPGDKFTVSVTLAFSGYDTFGPSYWLEVDNALAPFLILTSKTHFTFPDPNQPIPAGGSRFNSTSGSTAGFMLETTDLGATVNDPNPQPPFPPYHITNLTFMLAPGAPLGNFTLRSTTVSPRASEVTDTDFNDNYLPAASVTLNVVPEPSTLALLALSAGFVPMISRRRTGK